MSGRDPSNSHWQGYDESRHYEPEYSMSTSYPESSSYTNLAPGADTSVGPVPPPHHQVNNNSYYDSHATSSSSYLAAGEGRGGGGGGEGGSSYYVDNVPLYGRSHLESPYDTSDNISEYRLPPFVDHHQQHAAAAAAGSAAQQYAAVSPFRTPSRSPQGFPRDTFSDDPYHGYSRGSGRGLGAVDPREIADDGDDGLEPSRSSAGIHLASLQPSSGLAGGGFANTETTEKSEWLRSQSSSRKKWKWAILASIALVIIAAIVLGIYFGVIRKNQSGGASSRGGSNDDDDDKTDLDINSPEIRALLNNPDLHQVFPGLDYTPLKTQYPDCVHDPPTQNNITRDVAVLSQLTNTIRLYGTDCNQTEMTIHALQKLRLDTKVKLWLGVWQDNNATTNARQLSQMWDILDRFGTGMFKGLIVANEILFREQMTTTELGKLLSSVRTKLQQKGMSLPVGTSDLGDKWDAELASISDFIMANIHPFFGGVNAKDAAAWTYAFWQDKSKGFFKTNSEMNIISETGWPSEGGMDCGSDTETNCPDKAVAGVTQLNQFLADWVCPALANGTQYFFFEALDEPWKERYNSQGQAWEDHWGLLDVNRVLKKGVKIPSCNGKTVNAASK